MPDPKNETGLRDMVLLSFMYATGTRAQEVCDLTVKSVNFRSTGTMNIPVRQHRKSGRRETVCPGLRKLLMRVYSRNVLSKP
ncbi:MAG: tyrosine-type recombinase/integrase [Blautia sp.]